MGRSPDSIQAGDFAGILIEGVIVETIQVLASARYFAGQRTDSADALRTLVGLPGLRVRDRDHRLEALDLSAATNLAYVDCLLVAVARSEASCQIVSFDRDYDRIAGITRIEP